MCKVTGVVCLFLGKPLFYGVVKQEGGRFCPLFCCLFLDGISVSIKMSLTTYKTNKKIGREIYGNT
jgi:hypothetical protein